ncbi:lysylphosphatidylglycerol synthase transmembrane domain-containing protein [Streptodolium elevatio]|uniref:Lysylphosphatidylglycerol synthase transmembrane domain-containing protein n=1 Tax=Streptodolium elevatio TaxID=3157996 RepID=A0ABV3DKL7_9ACTN
MTSTATEPVATPDSTAKVWMRRAARLIAIMRPFLLLLAIGGIAYMAYSHWGEVSDTLSKMPWYGVAASGISLLLGMTFGWLTWQTLVDSMGRPTGYAVGARIMLVSQLGKYLPGSVWAYVLQLELGRKAKVSRARLFTATLMYVAVSSIISLVLGLMALPLLLDETPQAAWVFLLVPVGLVWLHPRMLAKSGEFVLKLLRRPPVTLRLTWPLVAKLTGLTVLSYAFLGLHLWLLAKSVSSADLSMVMLCVGAIAVGLTLGVVAFILPSGAGVRELVIVAALASTMPRGEAVALALVSRLMFTVADVVSAGVAALFGRRALSRTERDAAAAAGPVDAGSAPKAAAGVSSGSGTANEPPARD